MLKKVFAIPLHGLLTQNNISLAIFADKATFDRLRAVAPSVREVRKGTTYLVVDPEHAEAIIQEFADQNP